MIRYVKKVQRRLIWIKSLSSSWHYLILGCFALAFGTLTPSIHAVDDFDFSGFAALDFDPRERGLSIGGQAIRPQIFARLDHRSGWRAETSFQTVDDGLGADFRLKHNISYGFSSGGFDFRTKASLDGFYGTDRRVFYPEIGAEVVRDFGLAFIIAGVEISPTGRWNTPETASLYTYSALEVPVPTLPSLTLLARIGYDIRDNLSDTSHWFLGASYFVRSFAWNRDAEFIIRYEQSSLDDFLAPGRSFRLGADRFTASWRLYF